MTAADPQKPPASISPPSTATTPLFVDLDGTLIRSDMLWESLMLFARHHPLGLFKLPLWALRGRPHLKAQLADRVNFDVTTLPYRQPVLQYIQQQRSLGRRIVLATASTQAFARAVAEHLGLFDSVICTSDQCNMKGRQKLQAIQADCQSAPFDYVGDSTADLPIFHAANQALLVAPKSSLLRQVSQRCPSHKILDSSTSKLKPTLRALRMHQWVKNILLFAPLVLAHQVQNLTKLTHVLLATLVFCLTASAVYIFNDLLDLQHDRSHPRKKNRPFASGALSIPRGLMMSATLFLISAVASLILLPWPFTALLALYVFLTFTYSLILKRKLLLDVLCLAGLYTLRILAGAAAGQVPVSPWLMAFSMFFFLSLAFAKRYTELKRVASEPTENVGGRGYWTIDLDLIRNVGPTSGYLAVLVLCLYINSPDVVRFYQRPFLLWLITPLLLYWITRVWFLAQREQLHDDPVVFALRDRHSYLVGLLTALILLAASI